MTETEAERSDTERRRRVPLWVVLLVGGLGLALVATLATLYVVRGGTSDEDPRPSSTKLLRRQVRTRSRRPRTWRATRSSVHTRGEQRWCADRQLRAVGGSGSNYVCDREACWIPVGEPQPDACLGRRPRDRPGSGTVQPVCPQPDAGHTHRRHSRHQPQLRQRPRGSVPVDPRGGHCGSGRPVRQASRAVQVRKSAARTRLLPEDHLQGLPTQVHATEGLLLASVSAVVAVSAGIPPAEVARPLPARLSGTDLRGRPEGAALLHPLSEATSGGLPAALETEGEAGTGLTRTVLCARTDLLAETAHPGLLAAARRGRVRPAGSREDGHTMPPPEEDADGH